MMGRAYSIHDIARAFSEASLQERDREATARPLIKRALRSRPSRVPVVVAMAFSEVDLRRIEQTVGVFCGKRSPRHLKEKLRLMYAVKGHEVVIVELRPRWDNQTEWTETPVVKPQVHPVGRKMATVLDAG